MTTLRFNPLIQQYSRPEYRLTAEELREQLGLNAVYQMASNENPLGPSPKVVQAIREQAALANWYPASSDLRLREAIAQTIGRGLTADHIYTTCSGFEALEFIARGFLQDGDEYIVSTPTFSVVYEKVSSRQGAVMVDVPLNPETFAYNVDGVIAAITENTRLIFVCNPNNPTGTVIPAEVISQLMAAVPDHVLVVADEVYFQFVQDSRYPDTLQYVLDGRNVVITHSFSKTYALAGLRIGYGISTPEIANYLASLQRGFHQNRIAIAAGIAACQDREHLEYVVSYTNREKAWVQAELDRIDVRYWPTQTNFIMIETSLPADELTSKLRQHGVLVQSQSRLGLPYAIRASFSIHEGNVKFIEALEAILADV